MLASRSDVKPFEIASRNADSGTAQRCGPARFLEVIAAVRLISKAWIPNILGTVLVSACLSACDQVELSQRNVCPSSLPSDPSPTESGIRFEGSEKVTAEIASVLVECIPERHPPSEIAGTKRGAFTDYEIAAKAVVTSEIKDEAFFAQLSRFGDLKADLIFEAITSGGIVLGSTTGSFNLIANRTSTDVSAKIQGLSEEEIKRTSRVRARWKYGR